MPDHLDINPFLAMEVMEKAQELERMGQDVIHLEVGEPDFPTPRCVVDAAQKAISDGKTKYTHSMGLLELREAIAEDYLKRYGARVEPDQILVTSGTSPALLIALGAILDDGGEIVLSNPHYACYPNFIKFLRGVPRYVNIYEEDGFQVDIDQLKKVLSPRTKAIIVNSPANPTGRLLRLDLLKAIAGLGYLIISDEIYHGLVYGEQEHSILEFNDEAFVLNGFSKRYAMTGWRLGYVIAPKRFVRTMQKVQQNFFISANSFVQWGAIAALKQAGPEVRRMCETYDLRRKFIVGRLRQIGFGVKVDPNGAFYVLANAKKFSLDSYHFAFELLSQAGVAVTPGIDFGLNAEGYLRFSYANSMENIAEAMDRLERYLRRRPADLSQTSSR